jgi:DNA polymerase-3 subunit epsilon
MVEEAHAHGLRRLQVFDRWCHLGSAQDEAGALALAAAPRAFDADVWRIFARWLAVPAHLAQVRVLAASPGASRGRRVARQACLSAPRSRAAATAC